MQIEHHFSGNTSYYAAGRGKTVLLLHGWLHSGRIWENLYPFSKPEVRYIAVDLPGFGKTPPLRQSDATINNLSKWAFHFIKSLPDEHKPDYIIADSLGAVIMLQAFSEYTLSIKKLVLLGCPVDGLPSHLRLAQKLLPVHTLLRGLQALPENVLEKLIKYGNLVTMKKRNVKLSSLIYSIYAVDPGFAAKILTQIQKPVSSLPHIAIPEFILRGEFDRIVSRKSSHKLAASLRASYFEIQDSGHTPMLEQPESLMHILNKTFEL